MKWFLCLMAQLIWQESDLPVTPWAVIMPCSLEGLKVTELKNSHPSTTANLLCLLLAGQDTEQRPGLWPLASLCENKKRLQSWAVEALGFGVWAAVRAWGLRAERAAELRSSTRPKPALHTPHRPAQRPTRGNTRTSSRSPALPLPPGAGASLLISAQKFVGGFGMGLVGRCRVPGAFPVCLITMHSVRLWGRWAEETTGGPGGGAVGGTKALGAAKLASPLGDNGK